MSRATTDTSTSRAFTLIELLIVIAIIAILALIAVPNFLEAQVRAKVSRAQADMRSLATAVEAYAVDWGRPTIGENEQRNAECNGGYDIVAAPGTSEYVTRNLLGLSRMTTPVAYISTLPLDPFVIMGAQTTNASAEDDASRRHYVFQSYGFCPEQSSKFHYARSKGFIWTLFSFGPGRNAWGGVSDIIVGNVDSYDPARTRCSYDPSNGTISQGWIIRSNKGGFTIPSK